MPTDLEWKTRVLGILETDELSRSYKLKKCSHVWAYINNADTQEDDRFAMIMKVLESKTVSLENKAGILRNVNVLIRRSYLEKYPTITEEMLQISSKRLKRCREECGPVHLDVATAESLSLGAGAAATSIVVENKKKRQRVAIVASAAVSAQGASEEPADNGAGAGASVSADFSISSNPNPGISSGDAAASLIRGTPSTLFATAVRIRAMVLSGMGYEEAAAIVTAEQITGNLAAIGVSEDAKLLAMTVGVTSAVAVTRFAIARYHFLSAAAVSAAEENRVTAAFSEAEERSSSGVTGGSSDEEKRPMFG
ncbi:MAG: hypothetical protein A3E87_09520 [Gammaproteobacteria bacterium RIFCSPHIGHO2_12_FULL_35_23]|nr:MAG: hypothetical protein A3E87_09520 [Gammaproteobacteria bacterium RIFCSPHIGHO2_12_FULL_35_23]